MKFQLNLHNRMIYLSLIFLLLSSLQSQEQYTKTKSKYGFSIVKFGESIDSVKKKIENNFGKVEIEKGSEGFVIMTLENFSLQSLTNIDMKVDFAFDPLGRFYRYLITTNTKPIIGNPLESMIQYKETEFFCEKMTEIYSSKFGKPIKYRKPDSDFFKSVYEEICVSEWELDEIYLKSCITRFYSDDTPQYEYIQWIGHLVVSHYFLEYDYENNKIKKDANKLFE